MKGKWAPPTMILWCTVRTCGGFGVMVVRYWRVWRYGFWVPGVLALWLLRTRGFAVMPVGYGGVWRYGCWVLGGLM